MSMLGALGASTAIGQMAASVPVPDPNANPVSSGAPTGKTANGTIVTKSSLSARETMYISVAYVLVGCLLLGLGARFFRNAKIG